MKLLRKPFELLMLALAVVGLCHVLDYVIGDGALPGFRPGKIKPAQLEAGHPMLKSSGKKDYLRALAAPIAILQATSPPIARWVTDLQKKDRIIYRFELPIDHPSYAGSLAFQSPLISYLLLSPGFWEQSDLDEAAILAHEYRHHRQNLFKLIAERASQVLSLRVIHDPDNNRLEDEAYLYQEKFYRAAGHVPDWLRDLLHRRGYSSP